MSVNPDVDLGGFRREDSVDVRRPRRLHLLLIPLLVAGGFVAVFASTLTDLFRTAVEVTVVRPSRGRAATTAGQVLFQAAGWVEPDPFPLRVTPLVKGVVREVLVQESEQVGEGQPVALLYDEEDRFRLQEAEAALEAARAKAERLAAELGIADESYAAALDYEEKLGRAEAEAEGAAAEAVHRESAVRKAAAALKIAEEELELQRYLAAEGAAGPRRVEIAEAAVEQARGEVSVMKADAELSAAQARMAAVARDRMRKEGPLRFEERLRIEIARGELRAAKAEAAALASRRDWMKLALDRTIVRAPVGGIVLSRTSVPGTIVDPGMPDAPAICTLFDPANVRIRVDVPQDVVGRTAVNQDAAIFSESRRTDPYKGRVLRIVQQADINKVTLQVHVRVLDPDHLLRPEMLCQVRFLGAGGDAESSSDRETLRIPRRVLDGGSRVWVVAPDGRRAASRTVSVLPGDGEWADVIDGLNLSDKVIDRGRERLVENSPIAIREGT